MLTFWPTLFSSTNEWRKILTVMDLSTVKCAICQKSNEHRLMNMEWISNYQRISFWIDILSSSISFHFKQKAEKEPSNSAYLFFFFFFWMWFEWFFLHMLCLNIHECFHLIFQSTFSDEWNWIWNAIFFRMCWTFQWIWIEFLQSWWGDIDCS